jgi:hypothetical protein
MSSWMDWYGYEPARPSVPEQASVKEEDNGS